MKYRSEIDGLRALAIIPVILFHAGSNLFSGGFVGVDIFFVISGYLITKILIVDLQDGTFSIVKFYERRARRILPALFFVIFVCLPFAWLWLLQKDMKIFSASITAVSIFSSNILFWRTSGYFSTATELMPLIHTWSLAVEEQYYMLFPLFLLLTWRLGKKWIVTLLAIIAIISLAAAQWGALNKPEFTFFLLPTRAWELFIGSFIYFYYTEHNIKKHQYLAAEFFSILGFILIFYSIFSYDSQTPFPSLYALVPTLGAALIIIFATHKTLVGKLLGTKLFVVIGLISYSTYLWHQPLFAFARIRSLDEPSKLLMFTLSIFSIILGYLTWRYIERPFRNKNSFNRIQIFKLAFICSAIFIAIGLAGYFSNGFSFRLDKITKSLENPEGGRLDNCDEEINRIKGSTCKIGSDNVEPTIALVGDSHSTSIAYYFSQLLRSKNMSAIVYAQSWCPPILDLATDNPAKYPTCREYRASTFSDISKNTNIKTVIMFAEWSNYTKGHRWGDDDVTYYTDKLSTSKSLNENNLVFQRGILRTFDFLKKNEKEIIFINSVPEYNISIPAYAAKNYFYNKRHEIDGKVVTNEIYDLRNSEVNEALRNVKADKFAKIVQPKSIFCKNEQCAYMGNNNDLFYVDGNHLSLTGSKLLVSEVIKHIR